MTLTDPRLNLLSPGIVYRAVTRDGRVVVGEYLGMEVPYGTWALLLRAATGTESVSVGWIESIQIAA